MIAVWLPVAVATAALMEGWAGLVHDRLWHGPLWWMHEPHHKLVAGPNLNDVLSASHAPVAIVAIVAGLQGSGWLYAVPLGIGLGMTAFGLGYALVHDGFVHGRLPLRFLRRIPYFERIRRAHLVHHGTGRAPYGFFLPRSEG